MINEFVGRERAMIPEYILIRSYRPWFLSVTIHSHSILSRLQYL